MAFEREATTTVAKAARDIGLAAIIGGNLFARVGMHPALREVSDERERGKVVNSAWRRYGTVNSLGLAALVTGWAASREDAVRGARSDRERSLGAARDAAVAAVTVTGVAAAIQGVRFAQMEPGGAVPLEDGSETGRDASRVETRAKRRLNVFGGIHLAAALMLAGLNAALNETGPPRPRRRWPPARR
jgi:hypothetical protein